MKGGAEAAASVFDTLITSWTNQQAREDEKRQREAKQRAVQNAIAQGNVTFDQMQNILNDYNSGRIRLADDSMISQYKDLISNYQPQTYDFDKFSYDKTVDDYIDPNAQKIAELAGLETQASQAGQGAAGGTGAMAGMGYNRWKAAEQLYKDATQQYNQDRSQAYQEYGDYIDRMQKKLDTISQGQLNKISLLAGATQNEQQQQSDYISDLIGVLGDKAQMNIQGQSMAF